MAAWPWVLAQPHPFLTLPWPHVPQLGFQRNVIPGRSWAWVPAGVLEEQAARG